MCIIVWCDLSTSPFNLGVVGHGPQLFDAKDLAQFLNYTTGEASHLYHLRAWLGPKDRDVASIKKFSDVFCSLIRGYICQHLFSEVVLENQDVSNSMVIDLAPMWSQYL